MIPDSPEPHRSSFLEDYPYLEDCGAPKPPNGPNTHTWTSEGEYAFLLTAYTLQRWMRREATDWFPLDVKVQKEFHSDVGVSEPVLAMASVAFVWKGKVHLYEPDLRTGSQTLRAKDNVQELVAILREEVRLRNPLRRRHVQVTHEGRHGALAAEILPPPTVGFDDLVLSARMKEDLHDNTIFQLKHVPTNNGIILHGVPGTGKSLACKAIIAEAIREGFSTCFLVSKADFAMLDRFLAEFLAPCVLVLEDIDTFAEERLNGRDRYFADFLQFMSGLTAREDKVVVVATTNHLDLLDRAVKNRPLRFNRKYAFGLPTDEEVDRMLGRQFDADGLGEAQRKLCHGRQFTGAHIAEIKRTAVSLGKKRRQGLAEVFPDAVAIVAEQFSPTLAAAGFAATA